MLIKSSILKTVTSWIDFQKEIQQLADFRKTNLIRELIILLGENIGSLLNIQRLSKEEKEKKPSTIGDTIVKILYERAREPKELLKMLIDMGFPPRESEKTIEELVKKGAIEVVEVQIGKYGKKTLLRLKGSK